MTLINIVTGTDVKEINKAFGDSARQGRCLVPAGSCAAFETDGSCSRVGGVNDEVSKQDESPPSRQHTTRRMHHTHYVSVCVCVCVTLGRYNAIYRDTSYPPMLVDRP